MGHAFHLIHCVDKTCVMSLSAEIRQLDLKRGEYCETCSILLRGKKSNGNGRRLGAPETPVVRMMPWADVMTEEAIHIPIQFMGNSPQMLDVADDFVNDCHGDRRQGHQNHAREHEVGYSEPECYPIIHIGSLSP